MGGLDDQEAKDELPRLASALRSEINAKPDLAKLATSPLLCAIICALHRDRHQTLPGNRIGLYQACIDMFFRRDNERKVRMKDYVKLEDGEKLLLLRSLAWGLIRNGKTSVTYQETHERLDRAIEQLNPPPAGATGENVTRFFIHRVAMLQQFATGRINFPHRTFQEYLAAVEAISEKDEKLLVDNAEKEQWREVAILAAGVIENPQAAEDFVLAILQRGDQAGRDRQALYLVGAAARQHVRRLPAESQLAAESSKRLKTIIPPRSMKDAQGLSTAGNLVAPMLGAENGFKASPAGASIRTLALINTPAAHAALLDYCDDLRVTVLKQLAHSAELLPDDVQAEILRRAGSLIRYGVTPNNAHKFTRLSLSGESVSDVSVLGDCTKLEYLALTNCKSVSDVSALGNCTALQTLYLSSTSVSDVSTLGNCTALQHLSLNSTSVSDVSALGRCTALQYLNLNSTSVSDVSALGNCTKLRTLDLSFTSVSDVSALSNCTALQYLNLNSTSVSDVSALARCSALRYLYLENCPSVSEGQIYELAKQLPDCVIYR